MALIKEDGSIVPGANSYADIADADAFQTDRGRQGWLDADPTVQDAALVRATDYIDGRWELQFAGKPIGDVQDLAYPRKGVRYPATGNPFPEDEVPEDIVTATILYADQVIGDGNTTDSMTELSITPDVDSSNVKRIMEKVDVLETETEFFAGSASLRTIQPIPEADRLVRRWLIARGARGLTLRAG
jgi:hypothetical protein